MPFISSVLAAAFTLLVPTSLDAGPISGRLRELSRRLSTNNTTENQRLLQDYADTVSGRERAFTLYAVAMAQYASKEYAAAEDGLAQILGSTGPLNDYVAYYHARSIVLAEEFERALAPLRRFGESHPDSRFRPAVERLLVESLIRLQRLEQARALLGRGGSPLDPPVRLYLAGRVEHVSGNLLQAVRLYREAYYYYPFSDNADASEDQLNRLRRRLGDSYPNAPPTWRLTRAERLYEGRSYSKASAEFTRSLHAGLRGTDRERALVYKGAADYSRRSTWPAYAALAKLRVQDSELDAQRLYLLCALERRLGRVRPMLASVEKLTKLYPTSSWYEEALLTVGNDYFIRDDRSAYTRWFGRLASAFPQGKHAAYAHWKIAWRAWLDDAPERRALLTEHIERYPGASTASAALYWLGRLHEKEGRSGDASACYRAITDCFPHYYYALVARKRLAASPARVEVADHKLRVIRDRLPSPRELAPMPGKETQRVLALGDILFSLGQDADARRELQRVDFRRLDSHFVGLQLGRLHTQRGEHHLALRAMKRYVFGYLRFPLDSLDAEYWRYLFPMGFEDSLRARSKRHRLDPYLVAALIRQESEFQPGARSHAGALGLMQIMPATGRILFRRLGIPRFTNWKLTHPDVSLRLGTFHLKEVLAQFGGNLEQALAGYNAGERRIGAWMQLGPFDEPSEFVETIPFSETRGYVQSVLRNRSMYQRLYGD